MTGATSEEETGKAQEGLRLHSDGGGPECRALVFVGLTMRVQEARSMVPEWLVALLMLLKERWSKRRDAHVRFLKLQVEILRSRLPGNRVIPDPVERGRCSRLVRR